MATARIRYPPNQSPLYKLSNRRKLAELLEWPGTATELQQFAERCDNYNEFKTGIKRRAIQSPKPQMRALHERLADLLGRIEVPDYLHSGIRKRSFLTNAAAHTAKHPTVKLDIKSFYASTRRVHIYRFFHEEMLCAPDVSGLLTRLVCVRNEFLPTGSVVSQIMAFRAHRRMFDEIVARARRRGGNATVYVDDVTLTLPCASHGDLGAVGRIVERYGLRWHKAMLYRTGTAKAVTGVVINAGVLRAPNRQHLKIKQTTTQLSSSDPAIVATAAKRLVGLLENVSQIESRFRDRARGTRGRLKHYLRSNDTST